MKKLIKNVIFRTEKSSDKQESWLDKVPDAQVVKFCEEQFFLDKNIVGSTLVRHCNENGTTIAFSLESKTGETLYAFSEFLAIKYQEITEDIKFNDLVEDWIVLVSEFNCKNNNDYFDEVLKLLKSTFNKTDEKVQSFIEAIEMSTEECLI